MIDMNADDLTTKELTAVVFTGAEYFPINTLCLSGTERRRQIQQNPVPFKKYSEPLQ